MHKKLARSCMAAGVVSCMGFAGLVAGGSGVASASANVKRVADGTTTITVWTYWNQKFYPAIEKQFDAANPGLSIKFEPIPLPPSAGVGSYPLFTAKLKTAEISPLAAKPDPRRPDQPRRLGPGGVDRADHSLRALRYGGLRRPVPETGLGCI